MRRAPALAAVLPLAAACDPAPTSPTSPGVEAAPLAAATGGGHDKVVTVMTRNLYLGASIDPVIAALQSGTDPQVLLGQVARAWSTVRASNFPARAGLLAREIVGADADLVGLQEVSLWRTGPFLDPAPAATVAYDFLALLIDSLAARGASYEAVATSVNTDVELPSATRIDVRMTDRDVILAKRKLGVSNAQSGLYQARLAFPLPGGGTLPAPRGWTSVDVKVRGASFRFFNTHLETESFGAVQALQGSEAIGLLARSPLPVIAVGDFNSDADGSGTSTYGDLLAAGLVDAWSATRPDDLGLTCCHAEHLRNPAASFSSRIDLVLTRGLLGAVSAWVLGKAEWDRAPSGLWPSDHAGVVTTLRLPFRGGPPRRGPRTP